MALRFKLTCMTALDVVPVLAGRLRHAAQGAEG